MRASAAVGLALLTLAVGCGGSETPLRIGVLSDCYGPLSAVHELTVAAARLPLLERGGATDSSGVTSAEVHGRPFELLTGCVAGNEDVLPEARRLVEEEGASVLVGPLDPQQGVVLRAYAARRPQTVFLIQPSATPELTLSHPLPNVFRFSRDAAQLAAGLGSYAYHRLGWRTAATVGDDVPYGWGNVGGFVAEFCALGGRVVDRRWVPVGADPTPLARQLPTVDGVYLGTAIAPARGFLRGYSERHPDLGRRLLSSWSTFADPSALRLAPGVVVAGAVPARTTQARTGYLEAFRRAFPTLPAEATLDPLSLPYWEGVEAALRSFERGGAGELRASLGRVVLDSPLGRVRLDRNRQAVAPNYLSRVGAHGFSPVRVVPDVEQTFGGYFDGHSAPSRTEPTCVRRSPPSWARSQR
jgi:branched-chain amino acid transport system substrate-binding protein